MCTIEVISYLFTCNNRLYVIVIKSLFIWRCTLMRSLSRFLLCNSLCRQAITKDLVLKFLSHVPGGSAYRRTDRRIQGGVLTVRQRWRRHHHDERARHRHEIARTEPHRSRAPRHDQRGWRRRWVLFLILTLRSRSRTITNIIVIPKNW